VQHGEHGSHSKRQLRTAMREVRRAVAADPVDRLERSARIWARIVAAVGLAAPRRVMLFEGLPTEPETTAWFEWCREHDVDVFAPAVDGPDLRVEPGDVDPVHLDVVVVPGLAFTADGRRLGQGGGHYDRFLARLRPDCVTVGAAFAEQLLDDLPTDPHDARLDFVVTDA
jgi:5-formyltetrahydrofolate cyclo-ligase